MNALAHSTNGRLGKIPVTHLDPGHSRPRGTPLRTLAKRRSRRSGKRQLQEVAKEWR